MQKKIRIVQEAWQRPIDPDGLSVTRLGRWHQATAEVFRQWDSAVTVFALLP